MQHSSALDFFRSVDVPGGRLDTIVGERPNVWLYIHGPTHHWAISAKRQAGVLLPAAEAFSTIDALLAGSWNGYPEKELATAWAASIYDDHGWGGNQGQVTDQLFRSKADSARTIGRTLLDRAAGEHCGTREDRNGEGHTRRGVQCALLAPHRTGPGDPAFGLVPYHGRGGEDRPFAGRDDIIRGALRGRNHGDLRGAGCAVVRICNVSCGAGEECSCAAGSPHRYRRRGSRGTTASALRRADCGASSTGNSSRELLKTDKFLGGEIFTMRSVGHGAGEFTAVQQPTMEGFDKLSNHAPVWRMEEHGPVYTSFAMRQPLSTCTIVQKVMIYHDVKRIDRRRVHPRMERRPVP